MRYYLITIQYNKDSEAENRPQPKGYDSLDDAVADFHTQVGKDMKNNTLGWSLNIVIDEQGNVFRNERWTAEEKTDTVVEE